MCVWELSTSETSHRTLTVIPSLSSNYFLVSGFQKKKKETSKRAYIYTKRLNDACEYIYRYGVSDNNLFLLPMKMEARGDGNFCSWS